MSTTLPSPPTTTECACPDDEDMPFQVCGSCLEREAFWFTVGWDALAERISFTQPGVALHIMGAEVSIEVTAPDAHSPGSAVRTWEWYGGGPDTGLLDLARDGVPEDVMLSELVLLVHRSLVINAVHEVGEWLKVAGEQVFPPHRGWDDGPEGNGCVVTAISYDGTSADSGASVEPVRWRTTPSHRREALLRRLVDVIPSSTISYRPGTVLELGPDGPLLTDETTVDAVTGQPATSVLRGSWSRATLEALEGTAAEFRECALRDLHRAAVTHEVHEIGEFLRVDGQLAFSPHLPRDVVALGVPSTGPDLCGPVRFTLTYDA